MQDDDKIITVSARDPQNQGLQRLQQLQNMERQNFQGLDVDFVGKAGTSISNPPDLNTFLTSYYDKSNQLYRGLMMQEENQDEYLDFHPLTEMEQLREGNLKINFPDSLQREKLLYRLIKADGKLVRTILETQHHFRSTDSHDWNIVWLSSSAQPYLYEGLNEYQRVNHFPNSSDITRKDRMNQSIYNMRQRFGDQAYDFVPETFTLPQDYNQMVQYFHYNKKRTMWIVKPSCSSQGRGIFITDNYHEIPTDESVVVCRYISNPLLINGLKFDLRIYVIITCYDPLRIYVYPEGLARFATVPYRTEDCKNKFMHLTNYSINKKHENFVQNDDETRDDIGSKWSMSALFKHLEEVGIDTNLIWSRIYDLIIKSILAIEPQVVDGVRRYGLSRSNCFELFGFDVLLDSNLKPWLLEVNLSPSLGTDSPLDVFIKSSVISDIFNMIRIVAYDRRREAQLKARNRLRNKRLRQEYQAHGNQWDNKKDVLQFIQTNKFREILKEALCEQQRKGHCIRIFPSKGSDIYNQYFQNPRISNLALYYALYTNMMNAKPDIPTQVPQPKLEVERPKTPIKQQEESIVITGDDILIEYVSRVVHALKSIDQIKPAWLDAIQGFVSHQVWNNPQPENEKCWQNLNYRLEEMKERRQKLFKQGGAQDPNQKRSIIRGFSALQLEELLKKTSKDVAKELISFLIDFESSGLLTDIIRWLSTGKNSQTTRKYTAKTSTPDRSPFSTRNIVERIRR